MKRSFLVILICLMVGMLLLNININTNNVSAASFNYAEALQKAIYFYECQQSGTLPTWSRVRGLWKGDAQLGEAIQGGWVDAGDNVKFCLPMAYSASMLGWSIYEYGSAITAAGQMTALENSLKWVDDFLVACDQGGGTVVYQEGNPSVDHAFWGPIEVTEKANGVYPDYTCNASLILGEYAAALAVGSKVLNNSAYLTKAEYYYSNAKSVLSDSSYTAANGFYSDYSGFYDELCWSATWLYIVTGTSSYLTDAESYVSHFGLEGQTTNIAYNWSISWDDVHLAALMLLDRISASDSDQTNHNLYDSTLQNNLNWCIGGTTPDGTKATITPGGLCYIDVWGCLRYASNAAFLAFVYTDWTSNATLKSTFEPFAEKQINYILGSNPANESYIPGFGTTYPQQVHHSTAHGSWANSLTTPSYNRHTIYGAMVGGPNSSDAFTDDRSQYQYTEPACDYNALLVGNLAKMYSLYGGTALATFPVQDPIDQEFYVQAKINASGSNFTEIDAYMYNCSGFPARFASSLNLRYYMDLTELFNAGYTTSDLTITTNYVQDPVTVTLNQYSGNIYYVQVTLVDSTQVYPGGQSQCHNEVQFRISAPQNTTFWNPNNDWSYTGLTSSADATTTYIPLFDGNTLLWGSTPSGTTPPPATATPVVTATPTPVKTATPVPTATPVVTATPTPVKTATPVPTATPVVTATPTPVKTATPVPTATPVVTATPTPVHTATPVVTATPTPVHTATPVVTATPTPVHTATPVVTVTPTVGPATPTPVPGTIKVQFYNQNTSATSNQLYCDFQLVNTGTSAIALSTVTMRYFYTEDGTEAQNFYCDYSSVGTGNITGTIVAMSPTYSTADHYLQIGFTSGAGSIAAGASVPVQTRIAKSDWTNYTQTNDYSFNSTAATFVDWTLTTGYVNGVLQWGVEP